MMKYLIKCHNSTLRVCVLFKSILVSDINNSELLTNVNIKCHELISEKCP